MKYRVDKIVLWAEGTQTYEVEADTLKEACRKFKDGNGELVNENVELRVEDDIDPEDLWLEID